MDTVLAVPDLVTARSSANPPLLIDVRRASAFRASSEMITGALRRDPDHIEQWAQELPQAASVVVYSARGGAVSRGIAGALSAHGIIAARYLDGGLTAWRNSGASLMRKPAGAATRWITRERPKVDRIACPWLIRRFIDRDAEFVYVPPAQVLSQAERCDAIPYDIPDVDLAHVGEQCSFDAFMRTYRLAGDPALHALALIVRGADTARPDLAPQAAGLLAFSLGLSRLYADDHEMLARGMVLYDALYLWCCIGREQRDSWNPEAYRR
jgi:Uncharacterized conserved protein